MIRRLLFVVLLLTFLPIAAASTASAADATGCSGTAQSYSDGGGLLDSVAAPGIGGTKADPFDIFSDGTVRYTGRTDAVMRNGTWKVEVGGAIGILSFLAETVTGKDLLSGRINDVGDSNRTGEFATNQFAGKLTGLQVVTVRLRGEGGAACDATVWIRVHGAFYESILAVGGVIAMVIAFILFFFGVPTWAADNLLFEQLESGLSPSVPDDKE